MTAIASTLPKAFVVKRLHSLFGLMMVLFLMEHLITNSQMALLFEDNGIGFVQAVNFIKNLPYLHVIEVIFIGVPFLYHGVLGVKYALGAKNNVAKTDGSKPYLGEYERNKSFRWQRMTAWILLVGTILHVGYFRFYRYPASERIDGKEFFLTKLVTDPKLDTLANRLGVTVYSEEKIALLPASYPLAAKLASFHLDKDQVVGVTTDFGAATLLGVRDAFKSPLKALLYTIFVLAAVFHGFNGLWSFMITWGVIILPKSHSSMQRFSVGLMVLIGLCGLMGVWGSFWSNYA